MMNKQIKPLFLVAVDSIKTNFKKIFSYLSVLIVGLFANTTGNAAEIILDAGNEVASSQVGTVNITTTTDTLTILDTEVLDTASAAATVASMTSLGNTTAADATLAISGTMGLTVTGNVISAAQANFTITVDDGHTGNYLKIGGNVTAAANEPIDINLEGANSAYLEFNGADQTIGATVLSDGGKDGLMKITGSGTKTFSAAIGATTELGSITTAANTTAVFSAAADTVAVTNAGTIQFDGATIATTIANTGTVAINNATAGVAGSTTVTMTGASTVLNMNGQASKSQTMVVVAATDAHGTINVVDASGAAIAAVNTISGAIGTSSKKIKELTIGSSTANGSAVLTAAGFADAVTMTGGDHVDEDNILSLTAGITTDGISMVRGTGGNKIISTGGSANVLVGDITGSGAAATATNKNEIHLDSGGNTGTMAYAGSISGVDLIFVDVGDVMTLTGSSVEATTLQMTNTTAGITLGSGASVDQTITGAVTATADDNGLLTNNNAANTVTFDGAVGVEDKRILTITLADDSDTVFNDVVHVKNLDVNFDAAAELLTFEKAGNVVGSDGADAGYVDFAGGSVILGKGASTAGTTVINAEETTDGAAGVVIATAGITVIPEANFTSGTITFIDSDTASMTATEQADIFTKDNVLTDFSVVTTTSDASIVATTRTDLAIATDLGVTKNVAGSLIGIVDSSAAVDTAVYDILNDAMTNGAGDADLATVTTFIEQAAVQEDSLSGSTQATRAMTGTVQGIISNRMASLRSGDAYVTGMSAGNGVSANSAFIQAFGSEAEQDNTKERVGGNNVTKFGFDSETAGVAIGFDALTDSGSTVGISASYSSTDVTGKGVGKTKNAIDSYTVSAYGDVATENGYVEGSLTYGINENSNTRSITASGLNRIYKGAYDSEQISLKVGGGVPNEVKDGTFVTPFASATVTRISTDAYTETSNTANDGLKLKVAQDDIDSLVGSVGVKAHMVTDKGTPMISLAVNNEFGDNQISSTNNYTGGGTKFKTTTDVEELSATLGLGYSFGNDVTSLNLNYEGTTNDDDYISHYGSVKLVAKF